MVSKAAFRLSLVTDFSRYVMAPRASPRRRFSSPVITCTGMCRVAGSCFRRSRIVQPAMSGKLMSSVMAPRRKLARKCQRGPAAKRHQNLDAAVVRQVHQDAGEGDVVFDDQQHRVAGLNQVPIVVDFNVVHHRGRRGGCRRQNDIQPFPRRTRLRRLQAANLTGCRNPESRVARRAWRWTPARRRFAAGTG